MVPGICQGNLGGLGRFGGFEEAALANQCGNLPVLWPPVLSFRSDLSNTDAASVYPFPPSEFMTEDTFSFKEPLVME